MAGSFSFDTPEEVMHVLASIRSSSVSADQKNDLRDLVLSYTNGGRDQSVKIQIEQQLTALGIAPSVAKTSLTKSDPLSFGSSRNVPSFTTAEPVQAASPQPMTPPTPVSPPKSTQAAPVAAPVPHVATPAPEPATPPSTPTAPMSGDPLERIRAIKALVNEKVGNPVNLVDIDNEVGREYMSALLEAMKKVNSGGDAGTAMGRLEAAYTAVEGVLAKTPTPAAAPEQKPTTAPVSPATPVGTPVQSIKQTQEILSSVPINSSVADRGATPVREPAEAISFGSDSDSASRWADDSLRIPEELKSEFNTVVIPDPVTEPVALSPEQPAPVPVMPVASVVPPPPVAPAPSIPAAPVPELKPVVAPPPVPTPSTAEPVKPVIPIAPEPVTQSEPARSIPIVPEPEPVSAASAEPATIKTLSQTGEPLKKVTDLPDPKSLETSSKAGDPLYTKEVDSGLDQLLSDWVLFKKSGLFGNGPRGIEHPLFLKLKELQIPILLAGRFDGATQEIKQSITDYMNGWRYEQGIIYEQGESFEHYLRRVIRHIIDLQNK